MHCDGCQHYSNESSRYGLLSRNKILWEKVVYIKQMITQISICIMGVIKENSVFEIVILMEYGSGQKSLLSRNSIQLEIWIMGTNLQDGQSKSY